MKTLETKKLLGGTMAALALLLGSSPALLAQDSAKYNPTATILNLDVNVAGTKTITITSPSSLNNKAVFPISVPVSAISNDAGAPAASVTPSTLVFSGFNESLQVTVGIPASATPTTTPYTYTVVGNGPNGIGWGNGSGSNLYINVNPLEENPPADTTPPEVLILTPEDQSIHILGPIAAKISATDAQSEVSGVSATVNSNPLSVVYTKDQDGVVTWNGEFLPSTIGEYTIAATATSEGGTSVPVGNTFTVNYNFANGWLPPLSLGKIIKAGSTVPIKFVVKDSAGNFVVDDSVKVLVYDVSNGNAVFTGLFGAGSAEVRIDETTGEYITNFKTASKAAKYRVDVHFHDHAGIYGAPQGTKLFETR